MTRDEYVETFVWRGYGSAHQARSYLATRSGDTFDDDDLLAGYRWVQDHIVGQRPMQPLVCESGGRFEAAKTTKYYYGHERRENYE